MREYLQSDEAAHREEAYQNVNTSLPVERICITWSESDRGWRYLQLNCLERTSRSQQNYLQRLLN